MTNYWLMKSEPSCFSIDDLMLEKEQTTQWDGVRNYQARNFMRSQMKVGDQVFFYHSKTKNPGIVGLMNVVKEGYPDTTAFDMDSEHPDPRSTPEDPRWFMVDVQFKVKFKQTITLTELKACDELDGMGLLKRGQRLSVLPVDKRHWDFIISLAES